MKNFDSLRASLSVCFVLLVSIFLTSQSAFAQLQPGNPDRGAKVGNSYSAGGFDTINTTNGNLMINFPLGSLPAGRGELSGGISLVYNSKLYDIRTDKIEDFRLNRPPYFSKTIVQQSSNGGWKYTTGFIVEIEDRVSSYGQHVPNCSNGTADPWTELTYRWKVRMIFPDGSTHEMVPNGYDDPLFDGFYRVTPDGYIESCGGSRTRTGVPVSYYSIDGTYLRLEYSYDTDNNPNNNTWTLYMPDGKKVSGTNIYDRNGNYVSANGLQDQFGRSITITGNGNGDDLITTKGIGGVDVVWTVKWKEIVVSKTYQSCDDVGTCTPDHQRSNLVAIWRVVDKIIQPQQMGGGEYTFTYNAQNYVPSFSPSYGWGEISGITLPTGATTAYTYTLDGLDGPAYIDQTKNILKNYPVTKTLTYNREYDGSSTPTTETWNYAINQNSSSVTGPDGSITSESFGNTEPVGGYLDWNSGLSLISYAPDGSKTEKLWARNLPVACTHGNLCAGTGQVNPYVKTEFVSIQDANDNYVLTAIKDYAYDKNGNVTEVDEYDWMPYSTAYPSGVPPTGIPAGASAYLKRKVKTDFYNPTPEASTTTYNDPDSYHLASNKRMLRLPKSSEVQDGSSSAKSRSEIEYDYTNYDNSNTKAGNPTSTKAWDSAKGAYSSPLTTSNSITTSASYNPFGMPLTSTDARGTVTQITYESVGGFNDLYPTQTIAASGTSVARTSTASYDFYTGAVITATDVDNNISTITEYDPLGRPTKVRSSANTALESWTTTTYDDLNRRVVVKFDLNSIGDGKKVVTQFYDQLGRVRLSKSLENAATQSASNETDGIKSQTRYKVSGTCTFDAAKTCSSQITSNPYRADYSYNAGTESTMGWTLSQSRIDGRHSEIETFGGAALPKPFVTSGFNTNTTGKVQSDADANSATVTDQAGKQRRSITNGLGQLTRVDEPTASGLGSVVTPNQPTHYSYDTLGNMITVQQAAQSRYFLYSSLGRLLRLRQPEQDSNGSLALSGHPTNSSWTAGFTYDSNGNVVTTTDAKNVTVTNNNYDALNRPESRSYSDSTPTVNFYYDGNGVTPAPSFAKGKLTKVTNGVSESRYTQFDAAGRLLQFQQVTGLNIYNSSYLYYLSGALLQENYPSGRVISHDYDAAGNLSRIYGKPSASASVRNYANLLSYFPDGKISQLQLGNNLWEAAKLNSRLQVTELALGTTAGDGSKIKLNYEYGELNVDGITVNVAQNAGNIAKQTVSFTGQANPFVQTYKYDVLDRIAEARETVNGTQSWKQTFGFDFYGNRNSFSQIVGSLSLPINSVTLPSVVSTTNRFTSGQGYSYDANGNIVGDVDPLTTHNRSFAFNGDNKQTQVKDVTNGNAVVGTYSYDGEGKRVKKVTATETTVFVYDGLGKLVAEYSTATPNASPNTSYSATDQVGSPRVITNKDGTVVSRRDFMPFGEELYADGTNRKTADKYSTTGQDAVRQRFTGYQKDTETGLDFAQARMYQNQYGRFTAVDPLLASGKSANPQTFNRYIYVGNNPVNISDPTGLFGDYYSHSGQFLGNDGEDDKKVYFATATRQTKKHTYIDISSIRETNVVAVARAQIAAVPLHPGSASEPFQALASSVSDGVSDGVYGTLKGLGNLPAVTLNNVTDALVNTYGGPGGAYIPGPNPLEVPLPFTATNDRDASYMSAGTTGGGIGLGFVAGALAAEAPLSAVPAAPNRAGLYLTGKAPWQIGPGSRVLEGQKIGTTASGIDRIEPWVAHYDGFGRQIARTDFNAGNLKAGIPPIHYVTYGYNNGTRYTIQNHVPGIYRP